MLVIGLTGGIGSGKSTVARLFEQRGVPIVDADVLSRELVAPGTPALAAIVEQFGAVVIAADGTLDRAALRRRVFDDAGERRRLEAILHPAIRARTRELLDAHAESGAAYAINVVPLLVETGQQNDFDRVLVVDVTDAEQIERVMARDRLDQAGAERILASQASREQRLRAADDVIDNNGAPEALAARVEQAHRRYLELAAQRAHAERGKGL